MPDENIKNRPPIWKAYQTPYECFFLHICLYYFINYRKFDGFHLQCIDGKDQEEYCLYDADDGVNQIEYAIEVV